MASLPTLRSLDELLTHMRACPYEWVDSKFLKSHAPLVHAAQDSGIVAMMALFEKTDFGALRDGRNRRVVKNKGRLRVMVEHALSRVPLTTSSDTNGELCGECCFWIESEGLAAREFCPNGAVWMKKPQQAYGGDLAALASEVRLVCCAIQQMRLLQQVAEHDVADASPVFAAGVARVRAHEPYWA